MQIINTLVWDNRTAYPNDSGENVGPSLVNVNGEVWGAWTRYYLGTG